MSLHISESYHKRLSKWIDSGLRKLEEVQEIENLIWPQYEETGIFFSDWFK